MALIYTADELITSVRNRAMVPNTGSVATADSDILQWLNETMKLEMVPFLTRVQEGYFVVTELITAAARVRIPKRAIGIKLSELKYRPSGSGAEGDIDLSHISREDTQRFNYSSATEPIGFYLEAVDIVLVPEGTAPGGNLVVPYYFRPGDLVSSTDYRKVTVVAGSIITIDSTVPTSWTASSKFDVHSQDSGAEIKVWSASASTVGGTSITFSTSIDGSTTGTKAVAVDDYICLENNAAVPSLPLELHPMLAIATAAAILKSHGDFEGAGVLEGDLNRKMELASEYLSTRNDGEVKVISGAGSVWWGGTGYIGRGAW